MTPLTKARYWLTKRAKLYRWQTIGFAFVLGLTIAGLLLVGKQAQDEAATARAHDRAYAAQQRAKLHARDAQLAAAIGRIAHLEHPTNAELQRILDRLIQSITPAQATKLLRVLHEGHAATKQAQVAARARMHERARRTPRGSRSPIPPPEVTTPAPKPLPPSRPHLLQPIDPDGPGPLPSICLPLVCA